MPTTILIGAVLVIAALYVAKTLTERLVKRNVIDRRDGQMHTGVWLTEKSNEDRREEHREYLRERAKNDRHQDLD